MTNEELKKTQHYSKNELLLEGLIDLIPKNSYLIEPFYGGGDLVKNLDVKEYYDIAFDKENEHYRDTLKNPPDYTNKWVITNPPYLAKNKAKDKSYFVEDMDDLYKVAINSILEANGGILIVPINFLSDERSEKIRNKFFKKFFIKRLNIYIDSMFDDTDYNVCSFFFSTEKTENIDTHIYKNYQEVENKSFNLKREYGYRLGGDFFSQLKNTKNLFGRITEEKRGNPTYIKIQCIDKTEQKINFYYDTEIYYGKASDRNIATFSSVLKLSPDEQKLLIIRANNILNNFRQETCNICLTNYRDRGRKRIGFIEAQKILSMAYNQLKEEEAIESK